MTKFIEKEKKNTKFFSFFCETLMADTKKTNTYILFIFFLNFFFEWKRLFDSKKKRKFLKIKQKTILPCV